MPTHRVRRGSPFEDRYDSSGGPDACWPWIGGLCRGYGQYYAGDPGNRERVYAHRYALQLKLGRPVHPDLMACHSCNNPICVNPNHLYEGTDQSNKIDMSEAGTHGGQHLTKVQIRAIRADTRPDKFIAQQYGIAKSTVSEIQTRRRWAWLKDD